MLSIRNVIIKPSKPDKTFKPTTSLPACNPITTSNQFERLPDCPTDDVDVTSAPPFDVQMENVRFQRQVQFLRDQAANSVSAQQQRKPISTNKSYSETINNSSKQTIAMIGDSIIKQLDEKKLSNREKNVTVRAFSGATTADIKDYCKPIAKRRPNICIVHTDTNDLKDSNELSIVENIVKVKEIIENISPGTKPLISTLVNRYDSEELHHKALRVNDKLKQLLSAYDFIDNGTLYQSCVNKYGLHLSRKGTIHLAYNFKQILSNHL